MTDRLLNVKRAKRKRYLKLAEIAEKVCQLLEDEGVEHEEGCAVRHLAEKLWDQCNPHCLSVSNALRETMAYVGTSGPESNVTCEVDTSC